jgi:hypothetical protein
MDSIICKLGNIEKVEYIDNKIDGSFSFRVKSNEYFIPLAGNVVVFEYAFQGDALARSGYNACYFHYWFVICFS